MIAITFQGEDGKAASLAVESVHISGNRLEIDGDRSRFLTISRGIWSASPKLRKVLGAHRWTGYAISSPGS